MTIKPANLVTTMAAVIVLILFVMIMTLWAQELERYGLFIQMPSFPPIDIFPDPPSPLFTEDQRLELDLLPIGEAVTLSHQIGCREMRCLYAKVSPSEVLDLGECSMTAVYCPDTPERLRFK